MAASRAVRGRRGVGTAAVAGGVAHGRCSLLRGAYVYSCLNPRGYPQAARWMAEAARNGGCRTRFRVVANTVGQTSRMLDQSAQRGSSVWIGSTRQCPPHDGAGAVCAAGAVCLVLTDCGHTGHTRVDSVATGSANLDRLCHSFSPGSTAWSRDAVACPPPLAHCSSDAEFAGPSVNGGHSWHPPRQSPSSRCQLATLALPRIHCLTTAGQAEELGFAVQEGPTSRTLLATPSRRRV